jgi:hypothetical protein
MAVRAEDRLLEESLIHSPFLQSWVRKYAAAANAKAPVRVETTADVLGELETWILILVQGHGCTWQKESFDASIQREIAEALRHATPVLWEWPMVEAATQIAMPRHTVAHNVMPLPLMWWSFPKGIAFSTTALEPNLLTFEGLLLVQDAKEIAIVGLAYDSGTPMIGTVATIEFGGIYPATEGRGLVANYVLKMLAFMESPLLSRRVERGMTRAEKRRVPEPLRDQTVSVVTLRRRQHDGHRSDGTGDGHEYNVRWIVSGHLRAQWYPSLNAHKLIWIEPYLKGPEEAPLKTTLYKVTR